MAYLMTTELEIRQKAGDGLSISFGATEMTTACLRAESTINCAARENFSASFLTLSTSAKQILGDIVSSLVAIEGISYDMSGYTSRTEAENMINVLRDGALRGLSIIRDQRVVKFINGAA